MQESLLRAAREDLLLPPLEADEGALGVLLPLFPPLSIPEAELALSTLLCWCTLLIMEAKGLCMCIRWCP